MKLGNDIIEIDRIRQALEKSQSFRDRVYTPHEIDYCFKDIYETLGYTDTHVSISHCKAYAMSTVILEGA